MKVSSERRRYSNEVGNRVELKFKEVMESRGNVVKESTEQQNIYSHIDFFVNGHSVDVKGSRHLGCIWLELDNVHGNKGWLNSEVDYIAFDVEELNAFCMFKRADLLDFVLGNVTETTEDKREYLKYYTRLKWNKKDKLVKVRYSDIKHLLIQQIKYATT